jgi:serine/arginine repetitive matrix protein 2
VNGLRDGDDESIYSGRTSFASEYSTREPGTEGLQVVKDHARSGSKGSVSSFVSKKKPSPQQGKIRPETKVRFNRQTLVNDRS